jgi:protein phosphatase
MKVYMEKIAIISDIHGNIPALETVLKDIHQRGLKRIFCLGDLVGKGPYSEKAVDMCREVCETVVQGNWDLVMANGDGPEFLRLPWHRDRLGPERIDYLKNLPGTIDFYLSGKKIRLYHTSHKGVLERAFSNDQTADFKVMFDNTPFTGEFFQPDTVGFADIHRVFQQCRHGKMLFNTGSVGNPMDEPTAAYVILEGNYGDKKKGFYSFQVIRLPYDIDLAVKQAYDEEMPDTRIYEVELRTAVYRNDQPNGKAADH